MKRLPLLVLVFSLVILVFVWRSFAASPTPAANAPRYTPDQKLLRPSNYREWVYLSSGLGMN